MLERCVAIGQRPLALLLTPENRHAYKRVSNYIMTVRVACAQTTTPFVAGNRLDLASVFTSDQVRNVDGRCDTLPNFLAWMLANIGKFQHQGQDVLPLLPNPESATGAGITTTRQWRMSLRETTVVPVKCSRE
jgi:hypothetical protein